MLQEKESLVLSRLLNKWPCPFTAVSSVTVYHHKKLATKINKNLQLNWTKIYEYFFSSTPNCVKNHDIVVKDLHQKKNYKKNPDISY